MTFLPEQFTFDDVLLEPRYMPYVREDISIETRLTSTRKMRLPFIASPMDTVTTARMAIAMSECGGLGILHRNLSLEALITEARAVKDVGAVLAVALGPTDESWLRKLLREVPIDSVVLDNAHADSRLVCDALATFKRHVPEVIVGNIATAEAAIRLIDAGADALKVGIGSGSICTTRITTGVGVPQLSAIAAVAAVAKSHGVPVLADGGIRTSADVAKAIAAGADAVVLGNVLAGTSCAPGELVVRNEVQYKSYRGMGSQEVMERGYTTRYNLSYLNVEAIVPEGVAGLVPYKGETSEVVLQLGEYLVSSLYYCGARTIAELQEHARFVRMTLAGRAESGVHTLVQ